MDKQTLLHKLEKNVLSDPDNIFIPEIDSNESPAMQLLKQAVIAKQIHIDFLVHHSSSIPPFVISIDILFSSPIGFAISPS